MSQKDYFSSLPYKLIRRRWLVLIPIVLVMSLVFSYTRSVDLFRSSAIVTFQTEYLLADRDKSLKNLFEEKVSTVVGSLRFGESMRQIVQKVWPDLSAEQDPVQFNSKMSQLGSRNGVQLAFRRDNYRALNISYTSKDPDEAYRVVQATIDTLISQTHTLSARRSENSQSFLQGEIDAYKLQLAEIDQEITRLESGLSAFSESDLPGEDAADGELQFSGTNAGAIKEQLRYREGLPQLEFDLKVAEKELARLVDSLESGSYLQNGEELEGLLAVSDDYLLKELRTSIAQKEKERHLLASQGYLEKHPKRRSLEAELRNLVRLEQERIEELGARAGAQGNEIAQLKLEREVRSKIAVKTEEITKLRDKISVMKRYREELDNSQDSLVSQIDIIAAQRSRLEQLQQQKLVTSNAYHSAVTELEVIKRQGRAEDEDIGLRIEVAEAPTVPRYPVPLAHMSTILMGLAFSIAAGVGLVCVLDVIDTSVTSTSELRSIVQVPIIGEIDRMVTAESRSRDRIQKTVVIVFLCVFVLSSDIIVARFFL